MNKFLLSIIIITIGTLSFFIFDEEAFAEPPRHVSVTDILLEELTFDDDIITILIDEVGYLETNATPVTTFPDSYSVKITSETTTTNYSYVASSRATFGSSNFIVETHQSGELKFINSNLNLPSNITERYIKFAGIDCNDTYTISVIQYYYYYSPGNGNVYDIQYKQTKTGIKANNCFTPLPFTQTPPPDVTTTTTESKPNGSPRIEPSWIGYDWDGLQRVTDGITINEFTMDASNFHSDVPMQHTEVGKQNTIGLNYWDNRGPSNIKTVQLGSVDKIGTPLGEAQWLIEVHLNNFKNDITNPTIEKIIVHDKDNIIDGFATAQVSLVECIQEDTTINQECLRTEITYTYAKVPDSTVLITNSINHKLATWNNYFNDGLLVTDPNYIEPESITPYKYECKDKSLSEIMVPTRNNCNWSDYKNTEIQRIIELTTND